MKKNMFFPGLRTVIGAALSFLMISACNQDITHDDAAEDQKPLGSISLTIECDVADAPGTRGITPYTTVESYESTVLRAEVFVFDAATGVLNAYQNYTSLTPVDGHLPTQTLPCTQGNKHVYAVINGGSITGLSAVRTEDAFQALSSNLSQNGRTNTTGFIMIGRKDITVSGDNQACSILVKRLAFRVVLQKITNNSALGELNVKSVFLINSAQQLPLAMTDESTLPLATAPGYNIAGKKTGSSDFITSSTTSDVPEMLFQDFVTKLASGASSNARKMVYGYPHSASGTQNVRLVVLATLAGNDYYYPMDIPSPLANDTYTVELTIKNIGSSDPNIPVETGSASVTVTVDGWTSRDSIAATI